MKDKLDKIVELLADIESGEKPLDRSLQALRHVHAELGDRFERLMDKYQKLRGVYHEQTRHFESVYEDRKNLIEENELLREQIAKITSEREDFRERWAKTDNELQNTTCNQFN